LRDARETPAWQHRVTAWQPFAADADRPGPHQPVTGGDLAMTDETTTVRSRRALLAAAAGGAAALAANAALPLTALAADPNDVVLGSPNASTATTSIANSTIGSQAFGATASGWGDAIVGGSEDGAGLVGISDAGFGVLSSSNSAAGVYATSVSGASAAAIALTNYTGVYGWSPGNDQGTGTGVWGDSDDAGVFGSGYWGVYGFGVNGVFGHAATTTAPAIVAQGATASSPALEVRGKVKFSRSGRTSMASGASSLLVTLAGVSSGSKVFAVLATSESGRYVRAVVPYTGKFRVYLNTTLSSSAVVAWFVLD
jgi:hypothetical protein